MGKTKAISEQTSRKNRGKGDDMASYKIGEKLDDITMLLATITRDAKSGLSVGITAEESRRLSGLVAYNAMQAVLKIKDVRNYFRKSNRS